MNNLTNLISELEAWAKMAWPDVIQGDWDNFYSILKCAKSSAGKESPISQDGLREALLDVKKLVEDAVNGRYCHDTMSGTLGLIIKRLSRHPAPQEAQDGGLKKAIDDAILELEIGYGSDYPVGAWLPRLKKIIAGYYPAPGCPCPKESAGTHK